MKVIDISLRLSHPDIPVIVKDAETDRVCFEGTAESLLDYSGADYRRVVGLDVKDGVLIVRARA